MSLCVYGFVITTALFAGPVLALTQAVPQSGGITLVIVWPGADADNLVEVSGGRVIGPATASMGTLAVADDPAFISRLQSNGAWLVRDGTLIARLCGVTI